MKNATQQVAGYWLTQIAYTLKTCKALAVNVNEVSIYFFAAIFYHKNEALRLCLSLDPPQWPLHVIAFCGGIFIYCLTTTQ